MRTDTPNESRREFPTKGGRWGVRQFYRGRPTGGGTIGLGWPTEEAAAAANPPHGDHTFEPFERLWMTDDAPALIGSTAEAQ